MKNRKKNEILKATRFNKLSLNDKAISLIYKIFKKEIQIKNIASVYQFANLFNLSRLKNSTLRYLDRCFSIVSHKDSFLELEHSCISKILARSCLMITTEVEVFNAADRWLKHNIKERSEYSENLLLKVRLHLLSNETIRHLLNSSTFTKVDKCVRILNKILDCREKKLNESSNIYHASRYCNRKKFKLLALGGSNSETSKTYKNVRCIDVNKVGGVKAYPQMITGRELHEVVYIKGDIYVFGGFDNNDYWIKSVDKYSLTSKKWTHVDKMNNDFRYFCACAFMDKMFLIGGKKGEDRTNSCLQFDTSDYS